MSNGGAPGTPRVQLSDENLSAIYLAADRLSGTGQKRTKMLVRIELLSLIIAAVSGVSSFRVGEARLDVLAAAGAVFFLIALGATVCRSFMKTERDWYAGRAAAESVRTLAWRYALAGDPFPSSLDATAARTLFLNRIRMILDELREMDLAPASAQSSELTSEMEELRNAHVSVRREAYKRDRIENQIEWYTRRANDHRKMARAWFSTTILFTVVGLVGASLKFLDLISSDLLGVAAACATAAVAWNQLNQHRMHTAAYVLTARELNIIKHRVDITSDEQWALFVSDSEDAISREHVMWAARHGHPVIRAT